MSCGPAEQPLRNGLVNHPREEHEQAKQDVDEKILAEAPFQNDWPGTEDLAGWCAIPHRSVPAGGRWGFRRRRPFAKECLCRPIPSMGRRCRPRPCRERAPAWNSRRTRGHDGHRAALVPRWRLAGSSLRTGTSRWAASYFYSSSCSKVGVVSPFNQECYIRCPRRVVRSSQCTCM